MRAAGTIVDREPVVQEIGLRLPNCVPVVVG